MKFLIFVVAWLILLAICWPLALLVIVLAPLLWLISIPFRLLGICIEAMFGLVRGLLMLPARVLGVRSR